MKSKRKTSTMAVSVALMLAVGLTQEVAAVPGSGTLFGTDASAGNLITVDAFTGAGVVVGPTGIGVVPALAVDPATGVLYAGQGAGSPNLHVIDPATGVATLVGNTGLGFAGIGALDFRADGVLFAAVNIAGDGGTGSDHLAIVDKATGAASVIGPFGTCTGVTVPSGGGGACTIEGIEAIAFDAAGRLFGALNSRGAAGTAGLYTIDPATGSATFVAPIVDASGAPPSGGVVSLQFACDGTLYGGTARALSQATDGGRLITIDPTTGRFAFVGLVSATGGSSLGALAFQGACITVAPAAPQIPIPCTGTRCKIRIVCNLPVNLGILCTNRIDLLVRARDVRLSDEAETRAPRRIRVAFGVLNIPPGQTGIARLKVTSRGKKIVRTSTRRRLRGVLEIRNATGAIISSIPVKLRLK